MKYKQQCMKQMIPLLPFSEFSAALPTTNVVQIGLIDFQDEHRFLGIHISENLCNL
jgi:hypothetical protein